jgi:hypothetical protein
MRSKPVCPLNRVTVDEDASVDEIVLGRPCWLHVERMDKRAWWAGIYGPNGEAWRVWIVLDENGKPKSLSITCDDDGKESARPAGEAGE